MNTARKRNMPVFCCVITFVFCLALNQSVYGAEAWRSEWERTIKAAESEGEVSYYTLGEFGFLSAFEKKFPRVKVKVVQGRGNELLARIMTERRAGKYLADVARLGNTSPFSLYQAKVLQPVASAFILPEVKDESKWWSGKHQYVDSDGKYIFVPVGSVSVNMVAHNTELVSPAELSSFWDLLNEKWRGKIVVMDPRSGGYGRSAARTVFLPFTIGRGVFAPAFYRASCHAIAGLPPSHRLAGSEAFFRSLCLAMATTCYRLKRRVCRLTCSIQADGKKAARWSRARLPGLAGQIASPQCIQGLYQLAPVPRGSNGGSTRRRD
jgi:Bacterial extracellular solute-binding protein